MAERRQSSEEQGPDDGRGWTLGLVPSPEHCEQIASRIKDGLPETLRERSGFGGEWIVRIESDPLTGANVDIDDMLDAVAERKERAGWDVAIALSDLPIREGGTTIVAEGCSGRAVAVLSVPALGVIRIDTRVTDLVVELVRNLRERRETGEAPETDIRLTAPRVMGTLGLLAGMVYANRPWSLFPSFKTAVATAFATGGYGLIFTTLWEIGNTYGYGRLVALMIAAMTILVTWIILSHRLWETSRADVTQYQRSLYNATTVATIAVGVVFAYVIIFALLLLAAFIYIPQSMLESTIGEPALPMSYVRIAWVTSSVATIAGAIGASLENTEAVRKATFGWRQIYRWREYSDEVNGDSDSG